MSCTLILQNDDDKNIKNPLAHCIQIFPVLFPVLWRVASASPMALLRNSIVYSYMVTCHLLDEGLKLGNRPFSVGANAHLPVN